MYYEIYNNIGLILLKTHPRACKAGEQPCTQEHTYACGYCSSEFFTDADTHFLAPNGVTLPIKFWPACSLECYVDTFFGTSDSDPNRILDPNPPLDKD